MAIPAEHAHRHVYHFTHLENLPYILEHGLLSPNQKRARGIGHVDISNPTIQGRRLTMPVTCGPGGVVHDYVPFYFCKRTSMLQAVISSKNVDQQALIYIAVPITFIGTQNAVFSSASANTDMAPVFYNDPSSLSQLRWDLIDDGKWGWSDREKQLRMAELLVRDSVDVASFVKIITWKDGVAEIVRNCYAEKCLTPPAIQSDTHFYFTQYPEHPERSLVTGPVFLKKTADALVSEILELRNSASLSAAVFTDIQDAVVKMYASFCCYPALAAIDALQTENPMHREDVGAHTRTVVARLTGLPAFNSFVSHEKNLLVLSAFMHDTGKAFSRRNPQGQQRVDLEHPIKAVSCLKQLLVYDIQNLSAEDIRQIVMLVFYHDLIGDVFGKGRDKDQIVNVVARITEFDMLAALALADVESLVPEDAFVAMCSQASEWLGNMRAGLPELRVWVEQQLALKSV